MAKMKRSDLKQIVKECLIEILAEGLSDSPESLQESVSAHGAPQQGMGLGRLEAQQVETLSKRNQRRTAALDTPVVPNRNFDENVQNAVEALSADPMMQEILTDTARGSLQRIAQMDPALGSTHMAEAARGPNPNAGPQLAGDPSDIFDQISPGASSKWADLAFAPSKHPGVPQAN